MTSFEGQHAVGQLEKIKGGYYYLKIDAQIIEQFERKRHTRFVCHLDDIVQFQCGLNHLGDGNYYIIIARKYLEQCGKEVGSLVRFRIEEDPNPLGVDMPEVLQELLRQDLHISAAFEQFSDGKKRALIFSIRKLKDIDKQVQSIHAFVQRESVNTKKKRRL